VAYALLPSTLREPAEAGHEAAAAGQDEQAHTRTPQQTRGDPGDDHEGDRRRCLPESGVEGTEPQHGPAAAAR
jgi:hypothetical protein